MDAEIKTEVTATEPKAEEKPQSISERMEKSVTDEWARIATENATETDKPAEEPAKEPDGGATKTVETKPATQDDEPFSHEQLAEPKFWDGLDKAGWEKATRLHPAETENIRRAKGAASRIVNEAKKQAAANSPAEAANDKPTETKISPELKRAAAKANSLNEDEVAEGLREIAKLTLKDMLPEFGIDPSEAKAGTIARTAYANVIADNPEISKLDLKALDAAVEADASLVQLLEVAADLPDDKRLAITANVMRKAAETVMSKQKTDETTAAATKKAQDDKTRETQRKVKSNASNVSNTIVESPSGGAPAGKKALAESVIDKWGKAAAAEGV